MILRQSAKGEHHGSFSMTDLVTGSPSQTLLFSLTTEVTARRQVYCSLIPFSLVLWGCQLLKNEIKQAFTFSHRWSRKPSNRILLQQARYFRLLNKPTCPLELIFDSSPRDERLFIAVTSSFRSLRWARLSWWPWRAQPSLPTQLVYATLNSHKSAAASNNLLGVAW